MLDKRVRCDFRGQIYTFELGLELEKADGAECFEARDASSLFARLEPGARTLDVVLRILSAETVVRRWEEICSLFADCPQEGMLRLVAFGRVVDGRYAGRMMIATEPWCETLARALLRDGAPLPGLDKLYQSLAQALFRWHEQGFVHGAISTNSIVRLPGGAWALAPDTAPDCPAEPLLDVAGVGEVVLRALGLPVQAHGAQGKPLRGQARCDAVALQWQALRLGDVVEDVRPWYRRWFGSLGDQDDAPRQIPAVSAAWRTILDGLLASDPAQRWDAARMLFAGHALPTVSELRAAGDGRTYELSWTPPNAGDVAIYQAPAQPIAYGQLALGSALQAYGAPLAVFSCGQEPVLRLTSSEERHLQALTHIGEFVVGGADVRINGMPDVGDLQGHCREEKLSLQWEWPTGAEVVCAVIRTDRFATTPFGEQHVHEIARRSYGVGGARMKAPAPGVELFVSVFTIQRTQESATASSGATRGARWHGVSAQVNVRYWIERTPWLGSALHQRNYLLCVTASHSVTLPELQLWGGPSASPVRAGEGSLLQTFVGGRTVSRGQTLRLRFRLPGRQAWSARLFTAGPQAAGLALIHPPGGVRLD